MLAKAEAAELAVWESIDAMRRAIEVGEFGSQNAAQREYIAYDEEWHFQDMMADIAHGITAVPEWAWVYGGKGRIQRGTLTLFGERPGAGKSTSLRWLATQFSLGLAEGCWYGKPQNVAYIAAAEESLRYIVKPGLRAASADMSRIFFPEVESDGKEVRLSALADEEALTGALLENGITVVLVDPVMSTIGGQVDIHRNNETREHLEPWARVADAINGVVDGVAHLTKGNNRDVVSALNGSSAFGEVPRAVFGFAKDPKSEQGHRVSRLRIPDRQIVGDDGSKVAGLRGTGSPAQILVRMWTKGRSCLAEDVVPQRRW